MGSDREQRPPSAAQADASDKQRQGGATEQRVAQRDSAPRAAVQRRAGGSAAPVNAEAAGPPPRSSRAWTEDPLMDAAHRGLAPAASDIAVQAKGTVADDSEHVHRAAAEGVSGSGGALPHLGSIQQSFGPDHDVGPPLPRRAQQGQG